MRVTGGSKLAALAVCTLVLALLLGVPRASALPVGVRSQPAVLMVYQDGTVVVNQTMLLPDNVSVIYVPLLSPQVGDILVLDQSGSPVNYQLSGSNMTVYSLGDTRVAVTYDTEMLTSKNGSAWAIGFTTSFNATVILPMGATILSLSAVPISTSVQNSSPVVSVSPGTWTVDYGLSLTTETAQSGSATTESITSSSKAVSFSTSSTVTNSGPTTTQQSSQSVSGNQPSGYLIAVVLLAVVLVVAAVVLVLRRQRRGAATLRPDDVEVLRFIREKGGRVTEVEIRQRFSLPRTSSWRQVKRLEQLQYVRITKQGQQNVVELLKDGF